MVSSELCACGSSSGEMSYDTLAELVKQQAIACSLGLQMVYTFFVAMVVHAVKGLAGHTHAVVQCRCPLDWALAAPCWSQQVARPAAATLSLRGGRLRASGPQCWSLWSSSGQPRLYVAICRMPPTRFLRVVTPLGSAEAGFAQDDPDRSHASRSHAGGSSVPYGARQRSRAHVSPRPKQRRRGPAPGSRKAFLH